MSEPKAWEVLERASGYEGFFSIAVLRLRHTLFQGGWSEPLIREQLWRSDSVAVVLYDPMLDRVVLIEQFRVGALRPGEYPWLLEIVAGLVEAGEEAEEVARREAMEEAGCAIRHLLPIGIFYTSPGGFSEKVAMFCGIVDSTGIGGVHGLAEEAEDIRVETVDFSLVPAMLAQGDIKAILPFAGLQWLVLNRERIRREFS